MRSILMNILFFLSTRELLYIGSQNETSVGGHVYKVKMILSNTYEWLLEGLYTKKDLSSFVTPVTILK